MQRVQTAVSLPPAAGAGGIGAAETVAVPDGDAAAAEAADPSHGWEAEKEAFMAAWADVAASYVWLHSRSESKYDAASTRLTVPCIVLSTLTGTASFSLSGLFPGDADAQRLANYGIGGVQLLVGVLGTLSQYLKYAKRAEEHRRAAIDWSKLRRTLATTLALPPHNRKPFMEVLAGVTAELDRLEQAPRVPDELLSAFATRFGKLQDFTLPEAAGGLAHTHVYVGSGAGSGGTTSRTDTSSGSVAAVPLPLSRRLASFASAAAMLAPHAGLRSRVTQHLRSRAARDAVWREASVDEVDVPARPVVNAADTNNTDTVIVTVAPAPASALQSVPVAEESTEPASLPSTSPPPTAATDAPTAFTV